MDITSLIAAHKKLAEAREESFEPYDIDMNEIAEYLLGDDD